MASLGTLTLGTFDAVNSVNTAITGSDPVLETIAGTDDADWVADTSNTTHEGVAYFDLADMPANFGTIIDCAIRLRYAWQSGSQTNTWATLSAQIFRSDRSTALTNKVTVASSITTSTPTNSSVITLTGPDTSANKTIWDAAVVAIFFNISKNKGGDSLEERVFAAEVTGNYNIAAAAGGVFVRPLGLRRPLVIR